MIEKTFAIIKPLAVKEKCSGKIIDIIEKNGFNIINMKKHTMTIDQAKDLYIEDQEKSFFKGMINNMISSPIVILSLEKENAVKDWRKIMGATNPQDAEDGSIRKFFGEDIENNATHGSDSNKSADRELAIFFFNSFY